MKVATLLTSACLASLFLAFACKNQEEPRKSTSSTGSGSSEPKRPERQGDHITVLAHHNHPKPSDPVRVEFERFKVVKAHFDPQKIEGGTATIELDLSSLHTDSDERDEHLKGPAYFDVAKLATATITIGNVKLATGSTYGADATVAAHGMSKTYPVTFDVLDRKNDRITIKGAHTFARLDFGVGADPAQDSDESVGTDVTIELQLTLVTN